ncbi:IclR family transcriptional regulator domain-containing protein [Actinomycetospora flava]|uniref:IclR family transcriptional regulator C-terminal domain-containing protein n=1 Tax=Actinomycetospora flava TaxID=3129232 RepID=A0ABU8M8J2_9PSEU
MTDSRHGRGVSGGRSLKTAAEALAALRFLGAAEEGATAEALAAELGKSTATARYLLNTLCQEGFAIRDGRTGTVRLTETPPWGDAWGDAEAPHVLTPSGAAAPPAPAIELALARVRRRGHAADHGEHAEGICCLDMPISAAGGRVAAGIAISPPAWRHAPHAEEHTGHVRDVARTTTRGWREPDADGADLPPPPPADPVPPGY